MVSSFVFRSLGPPTSQRFPTGDLISLLLMLFNLSLVTATLLLFLFVLSLVIATLILRGNSLLERFPLTLRIALIAVVLALLTILGGRCLSAISLVFLRGRLLAQITLLGGVLLLTRELRHLARDWEKCSLRNIFF